MQNLSLKFLLTLSAAAITLGLSAQTYRLPGAHNENRLANQSTVKHTITTTPSIDYLNYGEEEEPEAGDIYDLGWNSGRVNCYGNATVPDRHVIKGLGKFAMPVPGYVTSPYGYRARFKRQHKGVDLKLQTGDTIYAAFEGRVRIVNYEAAGYGKYVVLRHTNELETVYGHMSKQLVKVGDYVKPGDPIGLGGSTGRSTGPHLHFETRYMGYAINPEAIFDFANQTTHTDTYTFDKRTYTQARNYSPKSNADYANEYNAKRAAGKAKGVPSARTAAAAASAEKSSKSASSKTTTAKAPAQKAHHVTVKSGDSLSRIAAKNGTTVDNLCKLNGMKANGKIQPGQKIRVK